MVVVWRFYDGYEDVYAARPDEERAVVTYIVLGSFEGTTVVCYIGGSPGSLGTVGAAIAAIGERTHARAWRHAEMPLATALGCVEQAKRNERVTLDCLQRQIAHLNENRASFEASGHRLAYGVPYCDAVIREITHEIRVRQVRDAFLLQVS